LTRFACQRSSGRPTSGGAHHDRAPGTTKTLTTNQWKLICTANVADLPDFFLIGYVTAALTKGWSLTYLQGGTILMASGIGAPPDAWLCGWLCDRIGRRTPFLPGHGSASSKADLP
jgi:hypothetical protein